MSILTSHKKFVEFDPMNKEHLEAFRMLTQDNRQHPVLRFEVPYPFLDVRAVMYDRISKAHLNAVLAK